MELNTVYGMINVKNEIIQSIIKEVPSFYSDIEKSIFIYIKICRHFSFCIGYFLEEIVEKHTFYQSDLSNDMNNLTNFNITCNKFSVLFSSILKDLYNIDTKIIYSNPKKDKEFSVANKYGGGHQSVIAYFNNFSICFDPLISFLGPLSDLYNAKNGIKLVGIKCLSGDEKLIMSIVSKVYLDILKESKIKSQDEFEISCNNSYDLKERIKLFNNDLQMCQFFDVDLLSYMLTCKNRYFNNSSNQYQYQASSSIIVDFDAKCNQVEINIGKRFKVSWQYILSIYDFSSKSYYYYKYNKERKTLEFFDKELLKNYIKSNKYKTSENFKIPGINLLPLDSFNKYLEYFGDDEVDCIEEYFNKLSPQCMYFLLNYLENSSEIQVNDFFSEIAYLDSFIFPCYIFEESDCINKKTCQLKRNKK